MPLTKAQGLFLSNDVLLAGLLENSENRMDLADYFPFFPVNGDSLRIERSQSSDFGVDPLFDPVPLTTTEGLAVPTASLESRCELKLMVQDMVVEDLVSINQSNVNSQVQVQLEAARKRLLYKFWKTFTVGDESVNPQEFSGVRKLCTSGQTIQTTDTVNYYLDLNDLSRMLALLTANSPCAIVTNPLGYKNILYAHYAKGVQPCFDPAWRFDHDSLGFGRSPASSRARLMVDRFPVFIDEFGPATETVGSFSNGFSIYAFVLGRGGLYGIIPASCHLKRCFIEVREVLAAGTTNTIYRAFMNVGMALDAQCALVRLQARAQPATL